MILHIWSVRSAHIVLTQQVDDYRKTLSQQNLVLVNDQGPESVEEQSGSSQFVFSKHIRFKQMLYVHFKLIHTIG